MAIITSPTKVQNKSIEGLWEVTVDDDGETTLRFCKQKVIMATTELYFDTEEALRKELLSYGLEDDEISDKIEEAEKEAFDTWG